MANWRSLVILITFITITLISVTSVNAGIYVFWNKTTGEIPIASYNTSVNQLCLEGTEMYCDFFRRMPKISGTFCGGNPGCGGSNAHTNPLNLITGIESVWTIITTGIPDGADVALVTHTHNSLNKSTTASNISIPPVYSLIVMLSHQQTITQLEQGMVVLYNTTNASAPPTNTTFFDPAHGYYIFGNNTSGNLGGQATHNHTNETYKTGNPNAVGTGAGSFKSVTSSAHTHVLPSLGWYDNANHEPLAMEFPMLYITENGTTIPNGTIVMSNSSTLDGNWTQITYNYNYYIRANMSSFNTTYGNLNHNHYQYNQTVTTGTPSASASKSITSAELNVSNLGTHQANISAGNSQNNPAYVNVTLWVYQRSVTEVAGDCWEINGKSLKAGINCLFYKLGGLFGL